MAEAVLAGPTRISDLSDAAKRRMVRIAWFAGGPLPDGFQLPPDDSVAWKGITTAVAGAGPQVANAQGTVGAGASRGSADRERPPEGPAGPKDGEKRKDAPPEGDNASTRSSRRLRAAEDDDDLNPPVELTKDAIEALEEAGYGSLFTSLMSPDEIKLALAPFTARPSGLPLVRVPEFEKDPKITLANSGSKISVPLSNVAALVKELSKVDKALFHGIGACLSALEVYAHAGDNEESYQGDINALYDQAWARGQELARLAAASASIKATFRAAVLLENSTSKVPFNSTFREFIKPKSSVPSLLEDAELRTRLVDSAETAVALADVAAAHASIAKKDKQFFPRRGRGTSPHSRGGYHAPYRNNTLTFNQDRLYKRKFSDSTDTQEANPHPQGQSSYRGRGSFRGRSRGNRSRGGK